jgi:hypothetical protein
MTQVARVAQVICKYDLQFKFADEAVSGCQKRFFKTTRDTCDAGDRLKASGPIGFARVTRISMPKEAHIYFSDYSRRSKPSVMVIG